MASRTFLLVLLAAALAACGRTAMKGSVADDHARLDTTSELDFWDGVAARRAVTNRDALHALLLFAEEAQGVDERGGAVAVAKARGWVGRDEVLPLNETARVGWIAKAVVKETGIRGGITMRILGPSERYSVRELNYMGWLPRMSPRQAISGLQLIALLSKAEDHQSARETAPGEDL